MKKYFSLLAMIFATSSLFVACGGDDDVNNGNVEVSVVGVWECYNVLWKTGRPKMLDSDLQVGERVSIKTDGTYSTTNYIKGKWKRNGNYLNIIQNAANAIAVDYTIERLTSTEMVLSGDLAIGKVEYRFYRVADNESKEREKLIDTWGMVSDRIIGQKISRYIDRTEIWVFTDTELTIYDDFDLLNGQTIPYSFSYDSYYVGHIGFDRKTSQYTSNSFYYNVKTLTSSTLVLINSYGYYGDYEEITFNKLKDNPRHTYTMDLTFNSPRSTQEISLNKFIGQEVVKVNNDGNWTNGGNWTWVDWENYGESDKRIAQPKIRLVVYENTSTSSRTCDITVIARNGNKVIIHITQQGKDETSNP